MPACSTAPGPCAPFTSKTTKFTYYANTSATDFDAAQTACNENGGHLVSYLADQEQKVGAPSACGLS